MLLLEACERNGVNVPQCQHFTLYSKACVAIWIGKARIVIATNSPKCDRRDCLIASTMSLPVIKSYLQELGEGGRDVQPSEILLLFHDKGYNFSKVNLKCFSMLNPPLVDKNKYLLSLKILGSFSEQKEYVVISVQNNVSTYGQKCPQNLGSMISMLSLRNVKQGERKALSFTKGVSKKWSHSIEVPLGVIYTAAVRANKYYSANPMNGEFTNDIDPIEIGSQVLIDILLLAKCGYFLHGESSVATLTSFFNPEMKLFFIGNLGKEVHSDGDFKENVLPVASTSEVEQDKELEEQAQSLTWYFKANGSYRTCPIMNKEQLIGPKKEDGDLKEKPFHVSSEDSEAEWEEGWDDQIQSLAWCFQANSLYSACPNMARGQLVDSKEVRTLLAQ
ncbi:hypothetical protein ACROYT_G030725 [Oculina patagonica]